MINYYNGNNNRFRAWAIFIGQYTYFFYLSQAASCP
jgi:hypothetical protein